MIKRIEIDRPGIFAEPRGLPENRSEQEGYGHHRGDQFADIAKPEADSAEQKGEPEARPGDDDKPAKRKQHAHDRRRGCCKRKHHGDQRNAEGKSQKRKSNGAERKHALCDRRLIEDAGPQYERCSAVIDERRNEPPDDDAGGDIGEEKLQIRAEDLPVKNGKPRNHQHGGRRHPEGAKSGVLVPVEKSGAHERQDEARAGEGPAEIVPRVFVAAVGGVVFVDL